jgi:hypothetical protein
MASAGEAFVLAPGEGRRIDLGAFEMTVKAGGRETGGIFSLLEVDAVRLLDHVAALEGFPRRGVRDHRHNPRRCFRVKSNGPHASAARP